MSKKCCGIIYNENEKFCTTCGKPLKDLPDILDMAEVDRIAASVMGDKSGDATKLVENEPASKEHGSEEQNEATTADSTSEEQENEATVTEEEKPEEKVEEANEKNEHNEDEHNEDEHNGGNAEDNAEDDEDEEEDDGTASAGLKFFGTLMILLMLAAIAAVGLGVYFIMLNPFYKNHDINNPVVYEQMATDTDVTNIETKPVLTEVSIELATPADASQEDIATDSDATATDATDETDETDETASDVSEDME